MSPCRPTARAQVRPGLRRSRYSCRRSNRNVEKAVQLPEGEAWEFSPAKVIVCVHPCSSRAFFDGQKLTAAAAQKERFRSRCERSCYNNNGCRRRLAAFNKFGLQMLIIE